MLRVQKRGTCFKQMKTPSRKIPVRHIPDGCLEDAIRGSVPGGKLANALIVLDTPEHSFAGSGCTQFDKTGNVIALQMPRGVGAYASGVRGHETRHATTDKGISTIGKTVTRYIADQVLSDCLNELLPVPDDAPDSYLRDNLVRGFLDLRQIRKAQNRRIGEGSAHERNGDILAGLRSLAIADAYPAEDALELKINLERTLGNGIYRVLKAILKELKGGREKLARNLLLSLLEGGAEREPIKVSFRPPEPTVEGLMPEETGAVKMGIVVLKPMGAKTIRDKAQTARYAPDGVILNPMRYLSAVISGDASGLFLRRRKIHPGGVVLIDSSGSMNVDAETLNKLCAIIPTATVAFYSGHDNGWSGKLCIYAHNRKRFSGSPDLLDRFQYGGNCVDVPALRWLLAQPAPRYLVSDCAFCGGARGDAAIAHLLLDRAEHRGQVRVIYSIHAAMEFFKKPEGKRPPPHQKGCDCGHCSQRKELRDSALVNP